MPNEPTNDPWSGVQEISARVASEIMGLKGVQRGYEWPNSSVLPCDHPRAIVLQTALSSRPVWVFTPDCPSANGYLPVPRYAEDISAAWEVVEELCAGSSYRVLVHCNTTPLRVPGEIQYECFIRDWDTHKELAWTLEDTAPLAICKAALRTKGIEV